MACGRGPYFRGGPFLLVFLKGEERDGDKPATNLSGIIRCSVACLEWSKRGLWYGASSARPARNAFTTHMKSALQKRLRTG